MEKTLDSDARSAQFVYVPGLVIPETGDQPARPIFDDQSVTVGGFQESLPYHVLHEIKELVEVPADIEQSDRLEMNPQLIPGEHLEELLYGPDPSG